MLNMKKYVGIRILYQLLNHLEEITSGSPSVLMFLIVKLSAELRWQCNGCEALRIIISDILIMMYSLEPKIVNEKAHNLQACYA